MTTATLSPARPLIVRRNQAAGVGYLIGSGGVAALATCLMGKGEEFGIWVGAFLLLYAGVYAWVGLRTFWDRSPRLILDGVALTDHSTGVRRVFPWHAIEGVRVERARGKYGEEVWATLILTLDSVILKEGEVRIHFADLEVGSDDLVREIRLRAGLP